MRGNCGGEKGQIKRNYDFSSDVETNSECTEKSCAIIRNQQIPQLKRLERKGCARQEASDEKIDPSTRSDKSNVETFLSNKAAVQSHPFTFIAAVKRKLALSAYNESSKRAYNTTISKAVEPLNIRLSKIDATSQESLKEAIKKMDFIKPLKVPDVKISPKTLDYASKESLNLRDSTSLKISMTGSSQKNEKTAKSTERVHRKLDFSLSDGHSFVSSDDVEPLRAPDLAISPSSTKQKEHGRDSGREKENRIKRMKKDESVLTKMDEGSQESTKKAKNPKHQTRKDPTESKRTKTERALMHSSRDVELTSKKPKSKNFATSTTRKDDEKRLRSSGGTHMTKSTRERSLESRGRTFSSDSLPDRCSKIHDKITTREQSRVTDSDGTKYNDDYEILHALRQIDEQKQKTTADFKPSKILGRSSSSSQSIQQKIIDSSAKEQQQQHKRMQDRTKASTSKYAQIRGTTSASEITEEIDDISVANGNKIANIIGQSSKETTPEEIYIDPVKVSLRDDSYSQQDEFCDLVTPELNLNVRSKRRKQRIIENDTENETKAAKHRARISDADSKSSESSFVHPSALHMQFQAELHLFDSYNESLRQMEGVEKCLYNAKNERGKELLEKQRLFNDHMRKHLSAMQAERDCVDPLTSTISVDDSRTRDGEKMNAGTNEPAKSSIRETEIDSRTHRQEIDVRDIRPEVRVAETQTPNDMATQTETRLSRHTSIDRAKQYPGITYERGDFLKSDVPELSLGSLEQFDDIDNPEDVSLPGKMRAMSEISLHETTSSIKTETGTEISMTTRDVTCSFNKYLDHEMAQLIKDEKLMYDKIEMLFKSREKTLNDRTRKLVKLEEQKRALRDTGQDSRISSVKKKQRALLLKLQQEKDEMNRLKELHKIASQERKLMLQKQRNMFNPQMSTKNILTKLKRSADCQSPRRLSGPMKGYDIRSNSSMSSLLESEKAQNDRAQVDMKILLSDSSYRIEGKSIKSDQDNSAPEKLDASNERRYLGVIESTDLNELKQINDFQCNFVSSPQQFEKTRKFEEKMPNSRANYLMRQKQLLNRGQIIEDQEESRAASKNVENVENAKSESDTLVEEFSKKSKSLNHENPEVTKELGIRDNLQPDNDSSNSRKTKALQANEESLLQAYKSSKKIEKIATADRDGSKKLQHSHEAKSTSKRKGGKGLRPKTTSSVLSENILRTKSNEDMIKPANNKRTKMVKELTDDHYQSSILEEIDLNESPNSLQALVKHSRAVKDKNYKLLRDIANEQHETKENIASASLMDRSSDNRDNDSHRDDFDLQNLGNISTRSQVSTFTISRHSSGDSEKSFSRSVVIRAQDHRFKTSKKLEEALNAREAALVARRNCVEDWIAWHAKLKAEECRVARMEQAAFKLVSTAANALSYNDTTVSSDTSDVEGRVELLAEKLAERRVEMARLRRETRKQAKRRLKALELNLLNQIKKYDATINEMQLKLETQKGAMKDSDKLAIESRSVADFKVPEIPLKRIRELYKSHDLLRSRSESDLILSKSHHTCTNENYSTTDNLENESIYRTSSLHDTKNSRSSEISGTRELRTNPSAESVLEEAKKFISPNAKKRIDLKNNRSDESEDFEDVSKNRYSEISKIDGTETIAEETKITATKEPSEISENLQNSGAEENSELFSEKLESLHLTNKNLNEDISTLENDLKALSEMMSQFSKKSDGKLKSDTLHRSIEQNEIPTTIADSSTKSTSRDISEQLSRSIRTEMNEEISGVAEDLEISISSRSNDFNPENSIITEIPEKSEREVSNFRDEFNDNVSQLISTSIPDDDSTNARTSAAIDFEARSKEILNVIEKSIISEHVDSLEKNSAARDVDEEEINSIAIHRENNKSSNNAESFEGEVQSISKIMSEISETNEHFGVVVDPSEYPYESKINDESQGNSLPMLELGNEKKMSIDSAEFHEKIEFECIDDMAIEVSSEPISPNENESQHETSEQKNSSRSNEINDEKIEEIVAHSPSIHDEKSPHPDDREEIDSIEEAISVSQRDDYSGKENSVISKKSSEISLEGVEDDEDTKNHRTNESSLENSVNEKNEEIPGNNELSNDKISIENDWTISDSFQVPERSNDFIDDYEKSLKRETSISVIPSELSVTNLSKEESSESPERGEMPNYSCDINEVSMFLPRGESTTIGYRFEDTLVQVEKRDTTQIDELDDILDIIARDSEQNEESLRVPNIIVTADEEIDRLQPETKISTDDRIIPRPSDLNLTAEVEPVLQKLTEILQGVERNIALRRKKGNDENNDVVGMKKILSSDHTKEDMATKISNIEKLSDQASDLETLVSDVIITNVDNENQPSHLTNEKKFEETNEKTNSPREEKSQIVNSTEDNKPPIIEDANEKNAAKLAERTFDILRDPEYEDISEESLEVSEILDRSETQRSGCSSRMKKIPEKYEIKQKSEDVLRILDEISQKSYPRKDSNAEKHIDDVQITVQVFGSVSLGVANKKLESQELGGQIMESVQDDVKSLEIEIVSLKDRNDRRENESSNEDNEDKHLLESEEPMEEAARKPEVDASSESSEGADTPRGVSEIEMDSPRDPNESRLDIDALDDDLLSTDGTKQSNDPKIDFPVTTAVVSSEKDIETMIDKLKASLEQPGLEVAELEAKLLRIEQLQIELEIKKLEAEEVSYYMREIPNKPPPPYTPPGGSILSSPQVSPTLPSAVVPSNVEELTAFTEKATILIFNAKNSGLDIMNLQPPPEIFQLGRDVNEAAKQDRRIYNTFLFDLCKETIAELYRSEYEKPGPSWTKPNVKTKPAMKIPKTIDELNDYVSKEIATLFGFKTKLQRENMVMRWSRKRRDRVDELLAREAQAEEDEWTKFHHDELAVKNELTVAILDTLILETTNCVKAVYAKKRKVVVA